MSDSVWPHRRKPTRLPHPWDSRGKNTGVGCHFLLQCVKVKSEREVAQSCPTLHDPMDCSLPGSSVHGILQARVLESGAIAFSDVDNEDLLKVCEQRLDITFAFLKWRFAVWVWVRVDRCYLHWWLCLCAVHSCTPKIREQNPHDVNCVIHRITWITRKVQSVWEEHKE